MNKGTFIKGTLIVDDRFVKNMDLETAISVQRSSLKTAIYGEGLGIYSLGEERTLNWTEAKNDYDNGKQIRQDFKLILEKRLSKNNVYKIINQVRAQPLTFTKY